MDFAIIETGGKQYRVSPGTKLRVEIVPGEAGASVKFDRVLLKSKAGSAEIGTPYLPGAAVEAKVLRIGRTPKVIVFRYHAKTRYRKKKTHRQDFTEVEVTKI